MEGRVSNYIYFNFLVIIIKLKRIEEKEKQTKIATQQFD